MSRSSERDDHLLVPANFVRAVRDSGYTSLSMALAELVDNALQAKARRVSITVERAGTDSLPEITVEDDGIGMSRAELETSLRFGGSSRFDGRESFGRFGMGLPAASLSQARRVEVTSWQEGARPLQVRLDLDAIAGGLPADLHARPALGRIGVSGCRVVWRRCDRIEYRRLAWLERALHRDLGRIYRRFLNEDLVLTINEAAVDPVDPLLLATEIAGHHAALAFSPMRYELTTSDGQGSFVHVRFAVLPVAAWSQLDNVTKRRKGIVGGGGVSILRAGREIAHGWHLMGAKRKENYDDWWRCEIEFSPDLDEHFGITINKQGIRPSRQLREALEPELESIARLLNTRVRQAFEAVKFQKASQVSCRIAERADVNLPVISGISTDGATTGSLRYTIGSEQLPVDTMFQASIENRTLELTLNVDHPAFTALYGPLQTLSDERGPELRTAVELLLLAFARASVQTGDESTRVADLAALWSITYGRMLQKS